MLFQMIFSLLRIFTPTSLHCSLCWPLTPHWCVCLLGTTMANLATSILSKMVCKNNHIACTLLVPNFYAKICCIEQTSSQAWVGWWPRSCGWSWSQNGLLSTRDSLFAHCDNYSICRFWDDWMREPEQRKDRYIAMRVKQPSNLLPVGMYRACIRPEVSRTVTIGKKGTSGSTYWTQHLQFIVLNSAPVDFMKRNFTYLKKVCSSCIVVYSILACTFYTGCVWLGICGSYLSTATSRAARCARRLLQRERSKTSILNKQGVWNHCKEIKNNVWFEGMLCTPALYGYLYLHYDHFRVEYHGLHTKALSASCTKTGEFTWPLVPHGQDTSNEVKAIIIILFFVFQN